MLVFATFMMCFYRSTGLLKLHTKGSDFWRDGLILSSPRLFHILKGSEAASISIEASDRITGASEAGSVVASEEGRQARMTAQYRWPPSPTN